MKAGSSGTMAGRAIFNEYFEQNTPADRQKFLQTIAPVLTMVDGEIVFRREELQ